MISAGWGYLGFPTVESEQGIYGRIFSTFRRLFTEDDASDNNDISQCEALQGDTSRMTELTEHGWSRSYFVSSNGNGLTTTYSHQVTLDGGKIFTVQVGRTTKNLSSVPEGSAHSVYFLKLFDNRGKRLTGVWGSPYVEMITADEAEDKITLRHLKAALRMVTDADYQVCQDDWKGATIRYVDVSTLESCR